MIPEQFLERHLFIYMFLVIEHYVKKFPDWLTSQHMQQWYIHTVSVEMLIFR